MAQQCLTCIQSCDDRYCWKCTAILLPIKLTWLLLMLMTAVSPMLLAMQHMLAILCLSHDC